MQFRLLIIASVLSTMGATAQDTEREQVIPKRAPGKNEIGLFAQVLFSDNSGGYANVTGLQYKRWAKPNIAYRIMGGLGYFDRASKPVFKGLSGDTILQTQSQVNVPMYFAGGGVEVQRHFYKKVTLYAAIELKAGYGSGATDDILIKELQQYTYPHWGNNYYYEATTTGNSNTTAFVMDATPFIGAKINFKRLCLGTEISAIRAGFQIVNSQNQPDNSTADFDAGSFGQRIYLNYRF